VNRKLINVDGEDVILEVVDTNPVIDFALVTEKRISQSEGFIIGERK